MKKTVFMLLMGALLAGGWAGPAAADEARDTHTVLVEFGSTTW